MPMALKITGLAEMETRVKLLQQQLREQTPREAVREAAKVILAEMRTQAPILDEKTAKSTALDPGTLKASLGIAAHTSVKRGVAMAAIGPRRNQQVAGWVEYGHQLIRRHPKGTVKLKVKGGGMGVVVGQVKAHPFLRPAFEASVTPALARMQEVFVEAVRRVLG